MEKIIKFGSREIPMAATAGTLRRYRMKFHRDLMVDMMALGKTMKNGNRNNSNFSRANLEMFENVAYIMARQADPSVPADIEQWLDGFEMFDIWEVLPQILEMWNLETATLVESKKNSVRARGK